MFDGIQEVEVNGVKRGFKFGPLAIAIGEREDGCKAGELFKKISEGDQLAILNLFYGAAVNYCKAKKAAVEFTASDVADWVYEMGIEKAMAVYSAGLSAFTEKNLKAPAKTGAGQ